MNSETARESLLGKGMDWHRVSTNAIPMMFLEIIPQTQDIDNQRQDEIRYSERSMVSIQVTESDEEFDVRDEYEREQIFDVNESD